VAVGKSRFFLVERYVSAADAATSIAVTRQMTAAGDGTRLIGTLVIASEETCLSVFQARDAREVAAFHERAGLPLDRIVEAEWFPGTDT
jgi:hypothetical protein